MSTYLLTINGKLTLLSLWFVDIPIGNEEIKIDEWRSIKMDHNVLDPLNRLRGRRLKLEASEVRETLK